MLTSAHHFIGTPQLPSGIMPPTAGPAKVVVGSNHHRLNHSDSPSRGKLLTGLLPVNSYMSPTSDPKAAGYPYSHSHSHSLGGGPAQNNNHHHHSNQRARPKLIDSKPDRIHHEQNNSAVHDVKTKTISTKINRIEQDINELNRQLNNLNKKKEELSKQRSTASSNKSGNSSGSGTGTGAGIGTAGCSEKPDSSSSPSLSDELEKATSPPLALRIANQNRKTAETCHRMFGNSLELPLYVEPSEAPGFKDNQNNFAKFKPLLIEQLRKRQQELHENDDTAAKDYDVAYSHWISKVQSQNNSAKRRVKDAKNRDFFEKVFPDLKKRREQDERIARMGTRGSGRSEFEIEEIASSLRQQELSDKEMHRSAVIPPLALNRPGCAPPAAYSDDNRFVKDPVALYKESQSITTWTPHQQKQFRDKFLLHPKNFAAVAHSVGKPIEECVKFYYLKKPTENYKKQLRNNSIKKRTGKYRVPRTMTPPQSINGSRPPTPNGTPALQVPSIGNELESLNTTTVAHSNPLNYYAPSPVPQPESTTANCSSETSQPHETQAPLHMSDSHSHPVESGSPKPDLGSTNTTTTNSAVPTATAANSDVESCIVPMEEVETRAKSPETYSATQTTECADCRLLQAQVEGKDSFSTVSHLILLCDKCNCNTPTRNRNSCPVPLCTVPKNKQRKFKCLSYKWESFSKEQKDLLYDNLGIKDPVAKACTTCYNRITHLLDPETVSDCATAVTVTTGVSRVLSEEDDGCWTSEEEQQLQAVLKLHGCDWEQLAAAIPSKSQEQLKSFYLCNRERLRLDQLVHEWTKTKVASRRNRVGSSSNASRDQGNASDDTDYLTDDGGDNLDDSEDTFGPSSQQPVTSTDPMKSHILRKAGLSSSLKDSHSHNTNTAATTTPSEGSRLSYSFNLNDIVTKQFDAGSKVSDQEVDLAGTPISKVFAREQAAAAMRQAPHHSQSALNVLNLNIRNHMADNPPSKDFSFRSEMHLPNGLVPKLSPGTQQSVEMRQMKAEKTSPISPLAALSRPSSKGSAVPPAPPPLLHLPNQISHLEQQQQQQQQQQQRENHESKLAAAAASSANSAYSAALSAAAAAHHSGGSISQGIPMNMNYHLVPELLADQTRHQLQQQAGLLNLNGISHQTLANELLRSQYKALDNSLARGAAASVDNSLAVAKQQQQQQQLIPGLKQSNNAELLAADYVTSQTLEAAQKNKLRNSPNAPPNTTRRPESIGATAITNGPISAANALPPPPNPAAQPFPGAALFDPATAAYLLQNPLLQQQLYYHLPPATKPTLFVPPNINPGGWSLNPALFNAAAAAAAVNGGGVGVSPWNAAVATSSASLRPPVASYQSSLGAEYPRHLSESPQHAPFPFLDLVDRRQASAPEFLQHNTADVLKLYQSLSKEHIPSLNLDNANSLHSNLLNADPNRFPKTPFDVSLFKTAASISSDKAAQNILVNNSTRKDVLSAPKPVVASSRDPPGYNITDMKSAHSQLRAQKISPVENNISLNSHRDRDFDRKRQAPSTIERDRNGMPPTKRQPTEDLISVDEAVRMSSIDRVRTPQQQNNQENKSASNDRTNGSSYQMQQSFSDKYHPLDYYRPPAMLKQSKKEDSGGGTSASTGSSLVAGSKKAHLRENASLHNHTQSSGGTKDNCTSASYVHKSGSGGFPNT